MKILLLLQLSISLCLATGPVKQKEELGHGQPWKGQQSEISESYMEFSVKMFKLISSPTARAPPNIMFSPLGVYNALSMLALGARSTTRSEILEGMGLDDTMTAKELREGYRKFLQGINQQMNGVDFKLGNDIFMDKTAKLLPEYQDNVTYYYNASIETISFSNPRNAEKTINMMVSERTDNKIQNMVRGLDSKMLMVIVGYSVFEATWESEFDTDNTDYKNFMLDKEKSVLVPMMLRRGLYKTYRDREMGCIVVEVPYTRNIVLLFIVPELGNLHKVEKGLTPQMIKNYMCSVKTSMVDLSIPKFSFNNSINVKYALLTMGMGNMFSGDNADFSRMSKKSKLKVSDIYEQSYASITEEGMETSDVAVSQSNYLFTNPAFNINRPFLMVGYQKKTKAVLWLSRIMDPSEELPDRKG